MLQFVAVGQTAIGALVDPIDALIERGITALSARCFPDNNAPLPNRRECLWPASPRCRVPVVQRMPTAPASRTIV